MFATASEVEVFLGKALSPAEQSRVESLIGRAERLLLRRWPDIPQRLDSGDLDADDVRDVVVGLVLPVFTGPGLPGVTSWSRSSGPYSQAFGFAKAGDGWSMKILPEMAEIFTGSHSRARMGWLL